MSRYADEELLPSWLATRLGIGALVVLLVLAGIGLLKNADRSQPDPWTSSEPIRASYADSSVPEAVPAPAEELVAATFLVVGPAQPAPVQAPEVPVRRKEPRQMAALAPEPGPAQDAVVTPVAAEQPAAPPAEPDAQPTSASA